MVWSDNNVLCTYLLDVVQMNYIELAKQVGLDWHTGWTLEDGEPNRFETLCKLAAAHEREACAKICDDGYFAFIAADIIRERETT
jgi:hypothetical protein